jgi:hypothetical protein
MKALLLNVSLASANYSGPGKLALTERSAFFFKPSILLNHRPSLFVHFVGGWAEIADNVVAGWEQIDRIPEHLRDPELRSFSPREARSLYRTSLLIKAPLFSENAIRRSGSRFAFETAQGDIIAASFWSARKIARHLSDLGFSAPGL